VGVGAAACQDGDVVGLQVSAHAQRGARRGAARAACRARGPARQQRGAAAQRRSGRGGAGACAAAWATAAGRAALCVSGGHGAQARASAIAQQLAGARTGGGSRARRRGAGREWSDCAGEVQTFAASALARRRIAPPRRHAGSAARTLAHRHGRHGFRCAAALRYGALIQPLIKSPNSGHNGTLCSAPSRCHAAALLPSSVTRARRLRRLRFAAQAFSRALALRTKMRLAEYEAVRAAVALPCHVYPDMDAILAAHPGRVARALAPRCVLCVLHFRAHSDTDAAAGSRWTRW
jgi:hypothetical protein